MAELSSFGWVFKSFCYMADKRTKYVALRLLVEMGKTNTYTHMDQVFNQKKNMDQVMGPREYGIRIVHRAYCNAMSPRARWVGNKLVKEIN